VAQEKFSGRSGEPGTPTRAEARYHCATEAGDCAGPAFTQVKRDSFEFVCRVCAPKHFHNGTVTEKGILRATSIPVIKVIKAIKRIKLIRPIKVIELIKIIPVIKGMKSIKVIRIEKTCVS
jgi:hypothetical protein